MAAHSQTARAQPGQWASSLAGGVGGIALAFIAGAGLARSAGVIDRSFKADRQGLEGGLARLWRSAGKPETAWLQASPAD